MTVDGETVTALGVKADPARSVITVDGQIVAFCDRAHHLMLNKPPGVLSTRRDHRGRRTIMEFAPADLRTLVYPVGRLDLQSTGLILLTNDGELAFRLTHPSHHVPKTYVVDVRRPPAPDEVNALRAGVELDDGMTAPAEVTVDPANPCRLTIVLYEGRKRQLRRMMRAVANGVTGLHRVAIGPLQLGDLPEGRARNLSSSEALALRKAVGLSE